MLPVWICRRPRQIIRGGEKRRFAAPVGIVSDLPFTYFSFFFIGYELRLRGFPQERINSPL